MTNESLRGLQPVPFFLRLEPLWAFLLFRPSVAYILALALTVVNALTESHYSHSKGIQARCFVLARWSLWNIMLLACALGLHVGLQVRSVDVTFDFRSLYVIPALMGTCWLWVLIWRLCALALQVFLERCSGPPTLDSQSEGGSNP